MSFGNTSSRQPLRPRTPSFFSSPIQVSPTTTASAPATAKPGQNPYNTAVQEEAKSARAVGRLGQIYGQNYVMQRPNPTSIARRIFMGI